MNEIINRGIGEGTVVRHVPTDTLWIVVWSALRCAVVPRMCFGPAEMRHFDLDEVEFGPDQEWDVVRAVPMLDVEAVLR